MKARIGMVNFINTAPLYVPWQRREIPRDWQVTEADPRTLCTKLYHNELDLGIVSSHEYAIHPGLYRILPDLSISATGTVGSVFLFSPRPPEELSGERVLMSGQSRSSVALVKIILEEFYRVEPLYVENGRAGDGVAAKLAIGDEALRLKEEGHYSHCLDLSEIWQVHTGLPFVFAVWTVREEFYAGHRQMVKEIHEMLRTCHAEGNRELAGICREVAPRIPMDVAACIDYLAKIEYDLGPEKLRALELFFGYLVKRGEASPEALPLKMCVL